MNRIPVLLALAVLAPTALAAAASAQLRAPVYPAWAALVVPPEIAKAQNLPEPAAELRSCYDAHRAALVKKPEAVTPLVKDHLGNDPVRRDCAMAAEVDRMIAAWQRSSSANGYGPLMTFISNQNKSVAAKSDLEKCQARKFIHDSAEVLNDIAGGMVPPFTYSWVKPVATAPCVAPG